MASPLGAAYSYAVLYLPMAGWITFLLAAGFGLCVGRLTARICRAVQIRNLKVTRLTAVAVQLVGYHFAWAVWVQAVMSRAEVHGLTLATCLRPRFLWTAIPAINEAGAWSLGGGDTPCTGPSLGLVWMLEAAIIFWACYKSVELAQPFCERCRKWCPARAIACLEPMDSAELQTTLETRQLEKLRLSRATEAQDRVMLELASCPHCNRLHALSARQFTIKVNDGKPTEQTTKLVQHLLLTPDEATAIQHLHVLNQP